MYPAQPILNVIRTKAFFDKHDALMISREMLVASRRTRQPARRCLIAARRWSKRLLSMRWKLRPRLTGTRLFIGKTCAMKQLRGEREMSKQVTIEGHIFYLKHQWESKGEFTFADTGMDQFPEYIKVMPHSFTVEIPDDFDPRPAQLAALDEKETALKAAFAKAMMELADDRAKLLCIESAVAI